jgi:hypothetical protein
MRRHTKLHEVLLDRLYGNHEGAFTVSVQFAGDADPSVELAVTDVFADGFTGQVVGDESAKVRLVPWSAVAMLTILEEGD